ncbi:uncharacterized protein LOC143907532 [Temnothorax americanus]|uniref:uncharacterized protein LOC143907532 n=1 Tax=Temnothorax americanus TaxID=1964332 RepID=UPI004068AA96
MNRLWLCYDSRKNETSECISALFHPPEPARTAAEHTYTAPQLCACPPPGAQAAGKTAPLASLVANSLARLMPNLEGASDHARRLYAATVHAVALYVAIATDPGAIEKSAEDRSTQSVTSVCTVSHAAATVLAGLPPLVLAVRSWAKVHRRTKALQEGGGYILPRARCQIKLQEKVALVWRWQEQLADAEFGQRTVDAVRSCLPEWLDSRKHRLSFHAVQVLTGHGCFGEYLYRIGKEATTRCHHCDEKRNTA